MFDWREFKPGRQEPGSS